MQLECGGGGEWLATKFTNHNKRLPGPRACVFIAYNGQLKNLFSPTVCFVQCAVLTPS